MNTSTLIHEWTAICPLAEIPRAGARVVQQTGTDNIAIFRASDDHVFAVLDRCPHKGGPLSAGLVHGHWVTCPLHSWTIGLEDGQAMAPDQGCTRTVAVKVDADTVYLNLAHKE